MKCLIEIDTNTLQAKVTLGDQRMRDAVVSKFSLQATPIAVESVEDGFRLYLPAEIASLDLTLEVGAPPTAAMGKNRGTAINE
jgi:hypothetical protein